MKEQNFLHELEIKKNSYKYKLKLEPTASNIKRIELLDDIITDFKKVFRENLTTQIEGCTASDIAEIVGVSRQRISQIIKARNIQPTFTTGTKYYYSMDIVEQISNRRKGNKKPMKKIKGYYSRTDVCKMFKVSEDAVKRHVENKNLKEHLKGGHYYYLETEIDEILNVIKIGITIDVFAKLMNCNYSAAWQRIKNCHIEHIYMFNKVYITDSCIVDAVINQ